ncbi:neural cell adhesion molecule 1-A-like [Haliotis asinina]|uniref:neural cell adhesion molecule 1-A-like n=1 Tax=Haliotis asinina TaxID=109174 RepID=UPI0035324AA2
MKISGYSGVLLVGVFGLGTAVITLNRSSPWEGVAGVDASISCSASCSSSCTVSWRKEGEHTFQWGNGTLLFQPVEIPDHGNYTCIHSEGETQSENKTIEVLVNYPTTNVSISLKNKTFSNASYTVTEGNNITLMCSVNGFPPPIIKWYKDGVNTNTEYLENQYGRHQHDGFASLYRVTDVRCKDGGTYFCQANNTAFSQSTLDKTVKVEVKCDPVLYDVPEKSKVYPLVKGETTVVNFTVQANPKPLVVAWRYFGKTEINPLTNISDYEHRWYSSSDNIYHLQLFHYDLTDNRTGLYSVVLSNGIRYSLNLTYTLSIESEHGTTPHTSTDFNGTTQRNETGVEGYCHDIKCTYIISGGLFLAVLILVLILATALKVVRPAPVEHIYDDVDESLMVHVDVNEGRYIHPFDPYSLLRYLDRDMSYMETAV